MKKQPVTQNPDVTSIIRVGNLSITPEMLDEIAKKMPENQVCSVRIDPLLDLKLAILAKKLRYEHKVGIKSGISKTTLVHWILENTLKDVEV
ncbi:MAG: hypothetical protein LBK47_06565 [Prevotellaceae bacterium]|nr:hypothetical protein [Prevotellaceae bacterium]